MVVGGRPVVSRLGLHRTALTLPLSPPPQKNVSPPLDSSPDTAMPGGMSICSSTSPDLRIDPAQLAFIGFPGAVPELAVDPGDAGDEAVRLDGAQDRAGLRIDLMDLAVAMLPDPERAFRPGHPGVRRLRASGCVASTRPVVRIDLLDAIPGDLEQVSAVEGGSRMRGDIERAHGLPARRDRSRSACRRSRSRIGAVIADPMHVRDVREGAVFADDICC